MEEKRYTTDEWKERIGPLLQQAFIDPAAMRKLIRMHRSPDKTTHIQQPLDTGENCFVTIDRSSFKVALLAPNGQYRCFEFNRRGQLVRDTLSDEPNTGGG